MKKLMNRSAVLGMVVLLGALFLLSGCILAPAIQSFKEAGITSGDRAMLLQKEVKHFQNALYWGKPNEALKYVHRDSQSEISQSLRGLGQNTKVVDSRVDLVDFDNSAYEADVEVTVRYYEVPYYVVRERFEKQNWVFSIGSGWKLARREVHGNDANSLSARPVS